MTTKHSPLRVLKQQADGIAEMPKRVERGETVVADVGGKIAAARQTPSVIFGVAMDDKFIKIEMKWATIRATSEAGISEYILGQMREARDTAH